MRSIHARLGTVVLASFVTYGFAADSASAGALLPERGGSPNADRIASLYTVVLILAAIVFSGVAAALAFALVRYRASRNPVAAQIRGNTRLEIAWTGAATGLIIFIAVFSLTRFGAIEHPDRAGADPMAAAAADLGDGARETLHVRVVGRQYIWMFEYPNGAVSYQELVAPVGVTVDLDISSLDVAHSWWIPKLGGKFDAIPGYVSHTWFRLERAGVYRGQCAELCGRNHADMTAKVRGVAPAEYARWVATQKRLMTEADRALEDER
jgi:cytochrome c oxidase subunit 2